jgi:hypothetical protein
MSLPAATQQDFYNLFLEILQGEPGGVALTDTLSGSIVDGLAGVYSIAAMELQRRMTDKFNKTFFSLAGGPAETGGPDDLQTLAVDHFGTGFQRPAAVQAIDTITFTRPTNAAGAILIPAGSVVKTQPDANGNVQRYTTNAACTLTSGGGTDLSVSVGITAVVAGSAGNAAVGTINKIETSLLDTTIVCSNTGNATGSDAQDTPTYRQTIANLILALAGATAKAVEAKAKTVSGVKYATAIEQALTVIQYNISTGLTVGNYFRVPVPYLYIADATGTASAALIAAVQAAILPVRALGCLPLVQGATAVTVNWTASWTLNPAGPHYSTFLTDATLILNSMTDYINGLAIGTSFVRATAAAAIYALWGPSGTNDLTAFSNVLPVADISATSTQKMIAGTMAHS